MVQLELIQCAIDRLVTSKPYFDSISLSMNYRTLFDIKRTIVLLVIALLSKFPYE